MIVRLLTMAMLVAALFPQGSGQSVADAARANRKTHVAQKVYSNEDEPPKTIKAEPFQLRRTLQDERWDKLLPVVQEQTSQWCSGGKLTPHGEPAWRVSSNLMEAWGKLRTIIRYDEDDAAGRRVMVQQTTGVPDPKVAPINSQRKIPGAQLDPAALKLQPAIIEALEQRAAVRTAALKALTDSCGFPYPR